MLISLLMMYPDTDALESRFLCALPPPADATCADLTLLAVQKPPKNKSTPPQAFLTGYSGGGCPFSVQYAPIIQNLSLILALTGPV